MASRFCSACGTKIEEGMAFCGACGDPAGTGAAHAAQPRPALVEPAPNFQPAPPAFGASATQPGRPNRLRLILAGAVVLLLVLAGAWLLFRSDLGGEEYTRRGLSGFAPGTAAATDSTNLIGRWSRTADCSRVLQFNADGTLVNPDGQPGTWILQDQGPQMSTIHISGGGQQIDAWLDRRANDHYRMFPVQNRPGPTVELRRC